MSERELTASVAVTAAFLLASLFTSGGLHTLLCGAIIGSVARGMVHRYGAWRWGRSLDGAKEE